jgi:EAL domain-containing protein (putative c-di-GMP-specific phosphodiesterase class I)
LLRGTAVAFQPIVSISQRAIWAHEALAWNSLMQRELNASDQSPELLSSVEENARQRAMAISATPDVSQGININVRPKNPEDAISKMQSIIDQAIVQKIASRKITLELNQDYLNGDLNSIVKIVQDCKENGVNICLDDFGAGKSGLNQLEMSQPNSIALNAKLIRDINTTGAKQAIVRGLMQTCDDLGIDVIAKHVETRAEFDWLAGEGIDLFQGSLFGNPQLDMLPTEVRIPQ